MSNVSKIEKGQLCQWKYNSYGQFLLPGFSYYHRDKKSFTEYDLKNIFSLDYQSKNLNEEGLKKFKEVTATRWDSLYVKDWNFKKTDSKPKFIFMVLNRKNYYTKLKHLKVFNFCLLECLIVSNPYNVFNSKKILLKEHWVEPLTETNHSLKSRIREILKKQQQK